MPAEVALVGVHMRRLDMPARYVPQFRNEYRRLIRDVTNMREPEQPGQASIEAFRHGFDEPVPNSSQQVFYSAVVDSPDLIDFLILMDTGLPADP